MTANFATVFVRLLWSAKWLLMVLVITIVIGGMILGIEGVDRGSEHHRNLWLGLYTAFITALTIGYGDFVPSGPCGRIVAVLLGVVGMLFTGIIVAASIKALERSHMDRREE